MQPGDEDEVPDDLTCPITFSLMSDPVVCVADGRVYECAALVRFWRYRPLADFYGGPELSSAAMRPAHAVRARAARWRAEHGEGGAEGGEEGGGASGSGSGCGPGP